jgi:2-desacetyl-2-hydroxyethyl bacteriochlorophyllide A dehydrogenase
MPLAKAVIFSGPRKVSVRDVVVGNPGAGEVVVRTLYSGVSSGSELLAYRGEIDPDLPLDERLGALHGTFRYPFQYGYSCVGDADGSLVFAFHPHQASFVAATDELLPIGDIDPRQATLLPMVETALQISLDAGPVLGDTVAVLGLGVVGTLTALVLSRAGAHVIGFDPVQWRRTVATSLGISTVDTTEPLQGQASVVIEASGNPAALVTALRLLSHEGTAIVASWYGTKQVALPLGQEFHRRRLTIRSTQVSTIPAALSGRWSVERRRAAAVKLLAGLPLETLATHAFPVGKVAEAFDAIDRGVEGLMHVALCYE